MTGLLACDSVWIAALISASFFSISFNCSLFRTRSNQTFLFISKSPRVL